MLNYAHRYYIELYTVLHVLHVAVMVFAYTTRFSIPYLMRVYRSCVELCADWLIPSSVASDIRRSAIFVLSTITLIVDKFISYYS